MLLTFIAVVVAVVGGISLWRIGQRPFRHRDVYPTKLPSLLQALLRRGFDGAVLYLELREHRKPRRFIQFAKRIVRPGVITLEFGFPDAPWSREYFRPMELALGARGYRTSSVPTGRDDTRAFLVVELEANDEVATKLAGVALTEGLQMQGDTKVDGFLLNVSPLNVFVDK